MLMQRFNEAHESPPLQQQLHTGSHSFNCASLKGLWHHDIVTDLAQFCGTYTFRQAFGPVWIKFI